MTVTEGTQNTYRVGLIVPSSNTTMETEIPRMLRAREAERPEERFTFHSSRMRMMNVTPEELRAMNTQLDRCAAELVAEYIESSGVVVQDALSLEVSDNLEVRRLDPENLKQHWKKVDLSGCDALVLSACVQMPSLSSIEPVEQACGLPVLSAATATTYCILQALELPTIVPGAGELLSGQVNPVGASSLS
jgi:maleate isomerase